VPPHRAELEEAWEGKEVNGRVSGNPRLKKSKDVLQHLHFGGERGNGRWNR